MSQTLKDLVEMSSQLEAKLLEANGEIDDEITKLMQETQEKVPDKIDAYCFIYDRLTKSLEFWKDEKKKIDSIVKNIQANLDFMKFELLKARQVIQLEGNKNKISVYKSGLQLEVIDKNAIPDKYFQVNIEKKLDKRAVLRDIKEGEFIGGVDTKPSYALRMTKLGDKVSGKSTKK